METSALGLAARMAVSLAVVLGLLWLAARGLQGRGTTSPARRRSAAVEVLSRQQLSRGSQVAVVRVGEQTLLVGVTQQQVTVLCDTVTLPLPEEAAPSSARTMRGPHPGWKPVLDALRERTVRRAT